MTHSCTGALEMAALLADVGPGDEVIMPSFTFVSTANAFVLRGATPVFVDILPDVLTLDPVRVEAAVTGDTRVIVPVHYAGIGAEMDALVHLASSRNLLLIEDAAQALMSAYRGRPLGCYGGLAAISFHETKNVHSGEGGALLINDPRSSIVQRSSTRRGRTAAGSSVARSTNTPGSTSAPRTPRARSSRRSCGRNSNARTQSRRAVSSSGTGITRDSRNWNSATGCGVPRSQTKARTTLTCTTSWLDHPVNGRG